MMGHYGIDVSRFGKSLEFDIPLAKYSWFRVGGPVDCLFSPASETELVDFLRALDPAVPTLTLGLGSNLLIRDGGFRGVAIRLGKAFQGIFLDNGYRLRVGAGAADVKVARVAAEAGIGGFAFLRGIPGSIGGALRMNCGAYGNEICDVFESARGVDRDGKVHVFDRSSMQFSYRKCDVPDTIIFTEAVLSGYPGEPEVIQREMNEYSEARLTTQPINTRTGGSTFKNPDGAKAWQLIDQAGMRGYKVGGAEVSEKHANFLIANDGATAMDIERLGEEVRRRVAEVTGISLVWEIMRVGDYR
jgi:UDP-N-acetylmuramate dehydrogenase